MAVRILLLLVASWLGSCQSHQFFVPREQATGEAPSGEVAAEYPLVRGGERVGDVRLWSHGAWDDNAEGNEADYTVVHLGFELENRSGAPLEVDPFSLVIQNLRLDSGRSLELAVPDIDGDIVAEPGATASVHFLFRTAGEVDPDAMMSFDAQWTVTDEQGVLVQQVTPFRVYVPPARRAAFYPGIYPGFYPGFYPRFGLGWSYCW